MKLISEHYESTEYLVESDEATGKKSHFITGIFLQAEARNRNNRIYPKHIIEREVKSFQSLIKGKRALGELNHPAGPTINLDKVSHIITELKFDGNNVIGKAKILGTPMGEIAKNFIDEGIQLGVSSRGMGSLKQMREGYSVVQDDYHLNTIDVVADPSGPDCWVNGIMEGVEYLYDEKSGMYKVAEGFRSHIQSLSYSQLEEQKVDLFKQFLRAIGTK